MSRADAELIKQLLDDALDEGILNDGQRESILESNSTKADRARCLIDTVRRKGAEASRKLIAHLQERDPTLFKELCLSCDLPAAPGERTHC